MQRDFTRYDNQITNFIKKKLDYYIAEVLAYKNTDLYYLYNEYLKSISELIKKISLAENIDYYFAIYYYLVYKGILSINNSFSFEKDSTELSIDFGISVVGGNGVCRNINTNFYNLLSKMNLNIKCYPVGILAEDTKIILPNHPNIPIKSNFISRNPNQINETIIGPNHQVLFVMTDDNYYLYDPTNFIKTQIDINTNDSQRKFFETRYGIMDNTFKLSKERRLEFLKKMPHLAKYFENAKWTVCNRDFLLLLRQLGNDMCESKKELISDFSSDNLTLVRKIVSEKNNYYVKTQK